MTVKELINKLLYMPMDYDVAVRTYLSVYDCDFKRNDDLRLSKNWLYNEVLIEVGERE